METVSKRNGEVNKTSKFLEKPKFINLPRIDSDFKKIVNLKTQSKSHHITTKPPNNKRVIRLEEFLSNNKKLKTEEPIIVKECFTCGDNDHQRITSLLCRFNPKSPKFVITKPKSPPKFLEIKPKSPSRTFCRSCNEDGHLSIKSKHCLKNPKNKATAGGVVKPKRLREIRSL